MSNNIFEKYASPENFKKLVEVKNVPVFMDKINSEYSDLVAVKTSDGDVSYKKLYNDVKSICGVLKEI